MLFRPKFAKKWILRSEFRKSNSGLRYHVCQFSGKTDNFNFFGPNLPKNGLWGWNFENLCPDLKLARPRYDVCQFSSKTDNFEFFGLNLGKLPNYVRYFGSYNVEGIAKEGIAKGIPSTTCLQEQCK